MAIGIGTMWLRREQLPDDDPDAPYNRVVVRGSFDGGESGIEVTLSPAEGFGPVIAAAPDSFTDLYAPANPDDPGREQVSVDQRFAGEPWQTGLGGAS